MANPQPDGKLHRGELQLPLAAGGMHLHRSDVRQRPVCRGYLQLTARSELPRRDDAPHLRIGGNVWRRFVQLRPVEYDVPLWLLERSVQPRSVFGHDLQYAACEHLRRPGASKSLRQPLNFRAAAQRGLSSTSRDARSIARKRAFA
jgi:hypothetical protein